MLRGLPGSIIKVNFFHFIFGPMTNKLCPPLPFIFLSTMHNNNTISFQLYVYNN